MEADDAEGYVANTCYSLTPDSAPETEWTDLLKLSALRADKSWGSIYKILDFYKKDSTVRVRVPAAAEVQEMQQARTNGGTEGA
jgi:hypothetical protein